jgi:hypothetical protein
MGRTISGHAPGTLQSFVSGAAAFSGGGTSHVNPISIVVHAKVALVACMRKLLTIMNAMLKHSTPWNPNRLDLQHSC